MIPGYHIVMVYQAPGLKARSKSPHTLTNIYKRRWPKDRRDYR